jgi:defect-in-organelle-trafficking protein DotD
MDHSLTDDGILMKLIIKTIFCAAIALSLGACVKPGNPQLVAEPDNVTLRLANAADRAANALDTLASIEQVRTPTDLPPLAEGAPAELRRSITVNWIGPVEPLVKQLADRASYTLNVTGNKPETAIVVTIDVRNQPVIETLRDVGLQLGGRAELKVDANLKIVELSYGNVQTEAP